MLNALRFVVGGKKHAQVGSSLAVTSLSHYSGVPFRAISVLGAGREKLLNAS